MLRQLNLKPCNDGSGKPIVVTVPPRCAVKLSVMGNYSTMP